MNYSKDIQINKLEYPGKEVGINWPSYGTVSVEEAIKFLVELESKIEDAKILNNQID